MSKPPVNKDGTISKRWKHGYSTEPLYAVWRTMLQRCYNKKHNRFHIYGGRGIEVDEVWWEYPVFRRWASKSGYRAGLQIDRIDTDGPYAPSNCRWATAKVQQRNRRNNRLETFRGQTKSLAEWADDPVCVVPYKVLWERLSDGWALKDALITPQRRRGGYRMIAAFGEEKSVSGWVVDRRCNAGSVATLWKRINDGWPEERAIVTSLRKR